MYFIYLTCWALGPLPLPVRFPRVENRLLYLALMAALPLGFFLSASVFSTLGVLPLTFPELANPPCLTIFDIRKEYEYQFLSRGN